MKKLLTAVSIAALSLVAPTVSSAKVHPTKADKNQAKHFCQDLRKSAGKQNFREMFGTGKNHVNAMRNCKRSQAKAIAREDAKDAKQAHTNAAKECKAERAEDPAAFQEKYKGDHGKSAYGRCVSQHAKENRQEAKAEQKQEEQDKVNAAQQCRAERKEKGDDAFRAEYGTNKNGRNAFGKCVSKKAKAQQDDEQQQS